jgi:hypothetical protein
MILTKIAAAIAMLCAVGCISKANDLPKVLPLVNAGFDASGQSFVEMLTECRISEAKFLLQESHGRSLPLPNNWDSNPLLISAHFSAVRWRFSGILS